MTGKEVQIQLTDEPHISLAEGSKWTRKHGPVTRGKHWASTQDTLNKNYGSRRQMVLKPQIYLAEGTMRTRQPHGTVTRGMQWASARAKEDQKLPIQETDGS